MLKFWKRVLPRYYLLQRSKKSEIGKRSGTQDVFVDLDSNMHDYRDPEPRKHPGFCNHFLVFSKPVSGRHYVSDYAWNYIDPNFLKVILHHVYEKLQRAAKFNLAFGFFLRNAEDGIYLYFYAHEKKMPLERSLVIANKGNLMEIQKSVDNLNIVKLSAIESLQPNENLICYQIDVFCNMAEQRSFWLYGLFITTSSPQKCIC